MTKKHTRAGTGMLVRHLPDAGRRGFIRRSAAWLGMPLLGSLAACGGGDGSGAAATPRTAPSTPAVRQAAYRLPAEDAPHASTLMAFASGADGIWTPVTPQSTDAGIDRVRADLMDVAKAIGATEPVDMLVLPADLDAARALLATASAANPDLHARYAARAAGTGGVNLVPLDGGFNDFWVRDTGCLFVRDTANGNVLNAVGFNFNGWGNANTDGAGLSPGTTIPPEIAAASNRSKAGKFFQPFGRDSAVAGWMAQTKGVPLIRSTLTLEGGAIEFDGDATAILTESAVLHVNRNPQLFDIPNGAIARATLLPTAKDTVLAELQRTLGVRKIIWLPGTATYPRGSGAGGADGVATPAGESDITNGHVDFYARFLAPGVVACCYDASNSTGERALTDANRQRLAGQTDASGRPLQIVELVPPVNFGTSAGTTLNDRQMSHFAAGYINFYTCNGALVMPKFNDAAADAAAVAAVRPYAGSRAIVQVDILGIASGGGGIHCSTREIPA
ncbi:peptidyl-arginine deiminase [Burkholderia sp. MSh2]|uniref:Peptidyl-arginine deiminase n=1 Tax=Burkholderia paludis TaxID=1506587 RepID=A0A6J5CXD0_9BURK|nr:MULTISPECIES: agmatine deiminase family protein [Burkholderia]KEZ04987.1 peptidyl-arginine deiminase [Burkholderia sp. MSh2]CAB3746658.1 Putative agmatine deiminase [Burkholderia paludis]VWB25907.1 peptidyl-arginine deiminase [Burkholderia paludis]